MKGNLFLLLLLLLVLTGSAQNASFDKALSELHGRYVTENVYLHLDKGICMAGDTLWFKGYVLEGNLLSGNSTSLHVELFDKTGYLILMKVFPLYDGITVGQLEIPANLTADVYYIRAYTKWQCNFDTRRLYQTPITIIDSKTNNATVLNRIHRNNNFSVTSGEDITLTSSNTPKGLHCTISCTDAGPYIDSTLQLYFIGAGVTGKTSFTLSREKLVKSALMPLAPELAGHEMDMILLSSSGRVILQDKVFFNAAGIAVDILTDTLSIAGKGLNSWRIRVKDTVSTLSVTVTDAEIDTNRISINNSISSTVLNYQDLIDGRFPDVNLVDSNYIRCRGVAQRISGRQTIRNKQLLAFITTKDSATSFEMIPIDSSGRFDLKNLFFYDTASVQFQLQDKSSRSKDIYLSFDWFSRPPFYVDTTMFDYASRTELQQTPLMSITRKKEEDLRSYSKIPLMKEVIVRAKKKTVVEKMDEEYASGAFKASNSINARSFDLINDVSALGMDLATYLQMRMPGVQLARDSNGRVSGLIHRGSNFLFFLNEMQVDYDMIASMSMFNIAYVVVHPAPFVMGRLMQGGVCVYTKKGSELETPDPAIVKDVIVAKKSSNKKLDKAYTSGRFSLPADLSIDLTTAYKPFDLLRYIKDKLPGFSYQDTGATTQLFYFKRSPKIFVDEREVSATELNIHRYKVNTLAYVKVLGISPGIDTPALALYTRKGNDINSGAAGLNKTGLPGYDRIVIPHPVDYSGPGKKTEADNRISLYWNPMLAGGENMIRFYNNDYTRKFRVVIEGVGMKGELLHFEKVIE